MNAEERSIEEIKASITRLDKAIEIARSVCPRLLPPEEAHAARQGLPAEEAGQTPSPFERNADAPKESESVI